MFGAEIYEQLGKCVNMVIFRTAFPPFFAVSGGSLRPRHLNRSTDCRKNVQEFHDGSVRNRRTFSMTELLVSSTGGGLSRGVRCRREPARRLLASVLHSSDSEEMFHALFF
jgi:hypothetical protein